ncbi:hypothetical protein EVAR_48295_1 [Eumeta japonica]|uniref:Uncharacterized protein n=1 Tax=Eumeta variegata TaxID=151549 RepID=A0A4C1WMF7_EUMVA|nr:hypothetical protein EVAR_48295_1 [Eumeta japonica]
MDDRMPRPRSVFARRRGVRAESIEPSRRRHASPRAGFSSRKCGKKEVSNRKPENKANLFVSSATNFPRSGGAAVVNKFILMSTSPSLFMAVCTAR